MTKPPVIVWYRSDLRVHDHPALAEASKDGTPVVPVFIFDKPLVQGEYSSANRTKFLLECLEDLKSSLRELDADLVIREGEPADELQKLAEETGAAAVYYSADYTPYAIKRDRRVEMLLEKKSLQVRAFGGRLAVSSLQKVLTKSGTPFKVFTPFWKTWSEVGRRDVVDRPRSLKLPSVDTGTIPALSSMADQTSVSPQAVRGGETVARKRLHDFLQSGIEQYAAENNSLGADATSRLSAYLHFGCLSVCEIETMLPDTEGARAWHRQLAWREFYHYVLFHFPHPEREFQERYRAYPWGKNAKLLNAWKEGRTGYPVVDAAMRQLKAEGWMHNRGRLIVGSFLTKDLGIDWREGERHFMQWLIDGDMANNNGNWQWIASVGVDPAPVFRRLYNPSSQRDTYDPSGSYVRTYVPELKNVPDEYLSEPWKMSKEAQESYRCIIGKDYPAPVVDHKEARQLALERFRSL
jgi:deoxyribodipyrimidine photo-lyase